jgi:uncharacterized Tic20 family protein
MGVKAQTHLVTLGWLFISAAIAQIIWPAIIWWHWDAAMKYIGPLPFGFVVWLTWYSFFVLIPLQIIIGTRIIWVGRHASAKIEQTTGQVRNAQVTCVLLIFGITFDIITGPMVMWQVRDERVLILFFIIMGGRALWTNLETAKRYWFA